MFGSLFESTHPCRLWGQSGKAHFWVVSKDTGFGMLLGTKLKAALTFWNTSWESFGNKAGLVFGKPLGSQDFGNLGGMSSRQPVHVKGEP
jgi:hypothetical protein